MPGFYGEQATRLQREAWDADSLADELYSMSAIKGPTATNRQLELTQNDANVPAIKIINNTGTTNPVMIQIVDKNGQTSTYCGCKGDSGSGNGKGGDSGGGSPKPPGKTNTPGGNGPGGGVTVDPPPGGVGSKLFFGSLEIKIHGGAFDGQNASFTSDLECFLYNPPSIPKPNTFFAFATGYPKLVEFLSTKASPYDSYSVVLDKVSDPGATC